MDSGTGMLTNDFDSEIVADLAYNAFYLALDGE
jgi:hypothetical protein